MGPAPEPDGLARIQLSARDLALGDGDTTRLAVTAYDKRDQAVQNLPPGVTLVWSSSDTSVARVEGGLVSAARRGEARIVVRAGTLADSARVLVRPVARTLQLVRGSDQEGMVARPLRDTLTLRVADRYGDGVPGFTVSFTITAGEGTVAPASAQTDSAGRVHATWTLGTRTGVQRLQAVGSGLAPVVVSARALHGPAAGMEKVSGDRQSGSVGQALAEPLTVSVRDAHGNAVPGAGVTWSVTPEDGSLDPLITTSDSAGLARARWTLGVRARTSTATAAGAGTTVSFSATVRAGAAAHLAKVSGDAQSAIVGRKAPSALVVRVSDAHGNPVQGAPVNWAVLGGGGTLGDAATATDTLGEARANWTMGKGTGEQLAVATAPGSQPAVFRATAVADVPAVLRAKGGSGQSATVGTAVTEPPSVEIHDRYDNPVPGVAVTWSVLSGGGSVAPDPARTGEQGLASARWTLGTTAGLNALSASVEGLPAVAFSATGTPGPVSALAVHGGAGQVVAVGQPLPAPLAVRASDRYGNAVPQVQVSWSGTGGMVIAQNTSSSGSDGIARASANVGSSAGYKSATASVPGVDAATFSVFGLGFTTARVTTGGGLSCALDAQGKAYCWGGVYLGGVGDGTSVYRYRPTPVSTTLSFVDITIGTTSACAVATDQKVYCWGQNSFGVLGNGTTTGSQLVPQPVSSSLSFTRVSGTSQSVCALDTTGAAHCWGRNPGIGDGTTETRTRPVPVLGGLRFVQIAAGNEAACGLTAEGAAYCWGSNYRGTLGDGTLTPRLTPVAVSGGIRFQQISTSGSATCGLDLAGKAYCWGYNYNGQVGDGTSTDRSVPTPVATSLTFVSISAGSNHTCARTAAGAAYCWGFGNNGSLGVGYGTVARAPAAVAGGLAFSGIVAGYNGSCGVADHQQVFCWGVNHYGQVGDGTTIMRFSPTGTVP